MEVAKLLLERRDNRRGRLPQARVRRAISTAYYALFHFLLDDAARLVVGTHHPLQTRRRVFMRLFTHTGMLATLNKLNGRLVQDDVSSFLRQGAGTDPLPVPGFARAMATAFADAQAKRHDADYNLNAVLLADAATSLIDRIEAAMQTWSAANDATARDFKHALALLMLQKGKLKSDG